MSNSKFDFLAAKFEYFAQVISDFGYPPIWKRPNTFETLVQIILEQQVSLASAANSFYRLQSNLTYISPEKILEADTEFFRKCAVTRQKGNYLHDLASKFISGHINLNELIEKPDNEIIQNLISVKGIGIWTCNVYLMMVANRPDIFPLNDIALKKELIFLLKLNENISENEMQQVTEMFMPYRTYAAFLLYWNYINRKKIVQPSYL